MESNEGLLSAGAVAYINVDTSVAGPGFIAEGTPQLDALIMEVTAEVGGWHWEAIRVFIRSFIVVKEGSEPAVSDAAPRGASS